MRITALHLLGILLFFQISCHLFVLNKIFMNDEGSFLTSGWLITRGKLLYKDIYLPFYLPGAPLIAAFGFLLIGPELYSAKLMLMASAVLTTLLIFFVSSRIYGEEVAIIASSMFILLAPAFGIFMFLAEPFMAPLVVLLFYSLYMYEKEADKKWLFASGLLSAFLTMIKLPGALFLPASIIYMLINFFLKKEDRIHFLSSLTWLFSGFLAPFLILILALLMTNSLTQAYEQVVLFPIFSWKEHLLTRISNFFPYIFLLIIPFLFFRVALNDLKAGKREAILLLLLATTALYAVLIRFQNNRVLYALPLVSIMAAVLGQEYMKNRFFKMTVLATCLIMASATVLTLALTQPIAEKDAIEEYILHHTSSNDTILVLPFGHRLYFLTKREPGFRYLGLGPWGQTNDTEINAINDMKQKEPKLIVYSKERQWGKDFREYEPLLDKYIWDNYEVINETDTLFFLMPKKK